MTTDTKPLAYAVAEWLQRSADAGAADADKLKQAASLVSEAFGVDATSAADKEKYAKGSPGLQAIFDVFLKTQKRLGNAAPAAEASASSSSSSATASASATSSTATASATAPSSEDATKAEALKNEGNKFMSSKDYGAALDAYTKAIELNPTSPVFYSNRAAAYSQIGQHEEAIADARKAAEIDPKFGKAYSRLGHALFASGRYSEAVEAYEQGLEVDPESKLMRAGLESSRAKANSASVARAEPAAGAGAGADAAADPFAALGGAGGAGGMPDLSTLMNNPMVSQMAQQLYVYGIRD
ncbi:Small glutamine-rich tetratricopeptide repeat-containing protein 2 [Malassezia cuniculi]|uniref:Small glutamine-rich tetratricopeptide repeat-containing protein 2 n=1 Tax=Malassezia cuniculi TaxID=948313 RepID=A0AAF0EYW9_9BASI|nr:Small glutamine-rich tetratricopeptide repeat-containing protein 2 [Malassezia cuniculi]